MSPPLYSLALRVFGALPRRVRRQLVRWGSPSFTVGALCVVQRSDGRILLVSQSYRGGWGLPGGLMARGEVPEDAVLREVREEVGLEVRVGAPTVVVDPEARRVDVVFGADPAPGQDLDRLRSTSPEIVDLGWFDRADLPRLQAETVASLAALDRAVGSSQSQTGNVDDVAG